MKDAGSHEGCIEQTQRLFQTRLFGGDINLDEQGRVRMDDWELTDEIQGYVKQHWSEVNEATLSDITDFAERTCTSSFAAFAFLLEPLVRFHSHVFLFVFLESIFFMWGMMLH